MFAKNFFSNKVVDACNELPKFMVDEETVNSYNASLGKFHMHQGKENVN